MLSSFEVLNYSQLSADNQWLPSNTKPQEAAKHTFAYTRFVIETGKKHQIR
jgi:hypothetical protein